MVQEWGIYDFYESHTEAYCWRTLNLNSLLIISTEIRKKRILDKNITYFKTDVFKVAAEILMKKTKHGWDVNVAGATAVT